MKRLISLQLTLSLLVFTPLTAMAFDSGSTGADGVFAPTADETITLPIDGVFNYTTFNIPAGVTITYKPNQANTPAIILVQNDAVIEGTIDISGENGATFGLNLGGPGGFAGGQGGLPPAVFNDGSNGGGNGYGPGGGGGGKSGGTICGGFGGAYGLDGPTNSTSSCPTTTQAQGKAYGSRSLVPLIGGSGGGGGTGRSTAIATAKAGAGGGGGGAILIAVSGTLTLNGSIISNGGDGQGVNSSVRGDGGGGSGGAVRLVATNFTGGGNVNVNGGSGQPGNTTATNSRRSGAGAHGRVRLEAENFAYTGTITPSSASSNATPQALFVGDLPAIRISTINGQAIPAFPTADVLLPSTISNPVTVEFAGVGVPLGNTIELQVKPISGLSTTVLSSALSGTVENSTASASVTLPQGRTALVATVAFTVASANQMDYSNYAMGEPVEKIKVGINAAGRSETTFVTTNGKEFTWPSNAVAMR